MNGLDASHPLDGAAVAAAGYTWAGRYLSSVPGPKVVTAAEIANLHAHNVGVLLVYEDDTTDLTGTPTSAETKAGVAVAQAQNLGAPAESTKIGGPAATGIFMACDQPHPPINVLANMTAAAHVIREAGFYAGFYGPKAEARVLFARSAIDVAWVVQTWGVDQAGDAWNFRQLPNSGQVIVGGVTCDVDDAPDPIGLWTPAPIPLPAPVPYPGDHMVKTPLQVTLDGNGNGWKDLAVPFASVFALLPNGSDPQTNHAYSPVPRLSASAEGAGTRVEVEGGPAGGTVLVWVATAA